jgi:hypothetical protein
MSFRHLSGAPQHLATPTRSVYRDMVISFLKAM